MRDRKSDTTHRRAAERKIGRPLQPGEVVHHVDEDKANNNAPNLDVTPRSVHTAEHNRGRGLSKLRRALRAYREGRKAY